MQYVLSLRPSSHSESYTLLAVFDSREKAAKTTRAMRKYRARCRNNKVLITIANVIQEDIDGIHEIIDKTDAVIEEPTDGYQELIITITLPPKISISAMPLIVDGETAKIVEQLYKSCPPPTRKDAKTYTRLKFNYAGPVIFYQPPKKIARKFHECGEFIFDDLPWLKAGEHFKVRGLI